MFMEVGFKSSPDLQTSFKQKPKKDLSGVAILLSNAHFLFENKEFDLALGLAAQALNFDRFHVGALRLLGQTLEAKKQFPQAYQVYQTLCQQDYGFDSLCKSARTLYLQERDQEAFEKYKEALSTLTFETEGLFEVYKNMGNLSVKFRDFEGAEEFYSKALTLKADSDQLYVNFGTLAIQREDWNDAGVRFRSALSVNPNNDKAWVGLAIVHNSVGDFHLAKANIDNAIEITPSNRTAALLGAQWAIRDQRHADAADILQKYLSEVDCDAELSLVLIHTFCLLNRTELALLEVERILLWQPYHAQAIAIEAELKGGHCN
jgi:tetratricopeptide (TPR) repeat protein